MSTPLSIQFTASSEVDASLLLLDSQMQKVAGRQADAATIEAKAGKLSFEAKKGQMVCHVADDKAPAILAIGVGEALANELHAEKAGASLFNAMKRHKMYKASLDAGDLDITLLTSLLYGAMSQSYEFTHYFTKKDNTPEMSISVACNDEDAAMQSFQDANAMLKGCLLYTSPSPRDLSTSRMPSSA